MNDLKTSTALTPVIAVIYCRVSSKAQVKRGDGLGSQERACRDFAKFRGLSVIAVFTDDLTGQTSNRPGLNALIEFVSQHSGSIAVIFDDTSRVSRKRGGMDEFRNAIKSAGGIPLCPNVEFGEDADSELHIGIKTEFDVYYALKNKEQTLRRMTSRMLNGYWVLPAPIGYKYELKAGRGKVLVRDEPFASIIQEALEGFANGRFQTQTEVKRFLELHSGVFKRDKKGQIANQRIKELLTRKIYTGFVEYDEWDISLREGQHDGLISLETFERIQERLKKKAKVPARKDLHNDFPLRGFVCCAECDKPLTSCWSTSKTGKNHPYYMCFNKACDANRKSIRRDAMHHDFEEILKTMQPTKAFFGLLRAMFEKAWNIRLEQTKQLKQALLTDVVRLESKSQRLIDKIIDESDEDILDELKKRRRDIKNQIAIAQEKADLFDAPKQCFTKMFELAMTFLSSPWKIWENGDLSHKRTVLKLGFSEKLAYHRKEGFRTPKTTIPFKYLGGLDMIKEEMAHPTVVILEDYLTWERTIFRLSLTSSIARTYQIYCAYVIR